MLDAHQLLWTQVAAGACLLISGGMLFNLVRMRGQMLAARSWDKIEGVITGSEVDQPTAHVSDDLDDATPSSAIAIALAVRNWKATGS